MHPNAQLQWWICPPYSPVPQPSSGTHWWLATYMCLWQSVSLLLPGPQQAKLDNNITQCFLKIPARTLLFAFNTWTECSAQKYGQTWLCNLQSFVLGLLLVDWSKQKHRVVSNTLMLLCAYFLPVVLSTWLASGKKVIGYHVFKLCQSQTVLPSQKPALFISLSIKYLNMQWKKQSVYWWRSSKLKIMFFFGICFFLFLCILKEL